MGAARRGGVGEISPTEGFRGGRAAAVAGLLDWHPPETTAKAITPRKYFIMSCSCSNEPARPPIIRDRRPSFFIGRFGYKRATINGSLGALGPVQPLWRCGRGVCGSMSKDKFEH